MSLKKIHRFLIAIIVIMSLLLGYAAYQNSVQKKNEKIHIQKITKGLTTKFKNDSLKMETASKILLAKTSQFLIDSLSNVYEDQLIAALNKSNTYKDLLNKNKISLPKKRVKKRKPKFSNNVISYKDLPNAKSKKNTSKYSNNVTSYTKLPGFKDAKNNVSKPTKYSSNVTTYSQISKNTTAIAVPNKPTVNSRPLTKPKNVSTPVASKSMHNNYELDHATNINDLDQAPLFKGCEQENSEESKKRCFASKISQHIILHFNTDIAKNYGAEKNTLHKIRILFVIDEQGNAKMSKVVGKWHQKIKNEVKRVIASTPKMIPGKKNGVATTVKFSMIIPFTIN